MEERARNIRRSIVKMLVAAGSGHTAGSMGSADFWTLLILGKLAKYNVNELWWEERDRIVLSAGHYAPVLYATLAEAGFFPREDLMSLRRLGSKLQGHPVARLLPGIEVSSGPLGQGISQAVGMAMSAKLDGKKWKVFCFMGDGEQEEGQVWEAYMCAAKYKLDNLVIVIDRNNIQIGGSTENVMPLEPLKGKLVEFGLYTMEVDGHNFEEMKNAFSKAEVIFDKPKAIILHTMPGKGVSFMEEDYKWHGKAPNEEEGRRALGELSD